MGQVCLVPAIGEGQTPPQDKTCPHPHPPCKGIPAPYNAAASGEDKPGVKAPPHPRQLPSHLLLTHFLPGTFLPLPTPPQLSPAGGGGAGGCRSRVWGTSRGSGVRGIRGLQVMTDTSRTVEGAGCCGSGARGTGDPRRAAPCHRDPLMPMARAAKGLIAPPLTGGGGSSLAGRPGRARARPEV